MAAKYIMRGYHPLTDSYAYWPTDEVYDTSGAFYTGPPRFNELVGVVLVDVIPLEELGVEIPFELTANRDQATSLSAEFTQRQVASREDLVGFSPGLTTSNVSQDTVDDPQFNNAMATRLTTDPPAVEYLGAPNYNIHELTLDSAPYAGRVDQKLLASTIGGATVVADAANVRQILNATNQAFSLQQSLTSPPTFSLANRGVVFATGAGDEWMEIPTADAFIAPTATARFSLSYTFQASSAFVADACFLDTGILSSGRSWALYYDFSAGKILFVAQNTIGGVLYQADALFTPDTAQHTISVVSDGDVCSLYIDDQSTPAGTTGTPGTPLTTEAGSNTGFVTTGKFSGDVSGRWAGYFRGMVLDGFVWPKRMRLEYQKYGREYVQDPATLHAWDDMQQYITVT